MIVYVASLCDDGHQEFGTFSNRDAALAAAVERFKALAGVDPEVENYESGCAFLSNEEADVYISVKPMRVL